MFGFLTSTMNAENEEEVVLSRCIDGDTAAFLIDGKEEKVRFLAIDTPEYTKEKELYGKEASMLTCSQLQEANTITLTYEESNKRDKYNRLLAWVFVDGVLLQELLVEQGLAEVKYIYKDYAYTDMLYAKEKEAKASKRNMWGSYQEDYSKYFFIAGLVILGVFVILFQKRGRKKSLRSIQREIKRLMK